MTTKDISKLIHNFDNLTTFSLSDCQVHGTLDDFKINVKARFQLENIHFWDNHLEFCIADLVRKLAKNPTLREKTSFNVWKETSFEPCVMVLNEI